ncbi:MAG: chemotaxis protein [Sulfurimonas sp. RIFOXYD12_FULL_33_39]|uniref:chemotaxis protein CheB n=1 Tax=unclassified Sulfurimonas TaxID=2623549 RepID=UPI0008AD34E0|nr:MULTISPECIES: chemotaxis protein CheB [unclassified Sulfurimonas]OHE07839.1 MAG: chemotaxis protein [Sulfurimonas sp. RIFCSPLOWO2_12_FULL_34_6]OHE09814.1 MAG: chemotaxis protein [Sulfurimonas sp. RIFOXYD12_FULL_33_39]OHE13678.1 MAG: chemotaxis protein [Sulfurimonas sp. RIFOXYD2_FULL_34_21]DAB28113.1 MAG TPA: chemotaxis protein [Sulfurimonas sp. UBA10385]
MQNSNYSIPSKIVLIGASTGGPGQIEKIISSLPILRNTSVIIAQHMAMDFIPSFAKRLQEHSLNSVTLANNNTLLESGNVYLCFGSTIIKKNASILNFKTSPSKAHKYNPDINAIFNSFVLFAKNIEILGVILTGIGDDGVDGCKQLSQAGAKAVTQTESSAIVDGMTARARAEVPNIEVLDIVEIRDKIMRFCS